MPALDRPAPPSRPLHRRPHLRAGVWLAAWTLVAACDPPRDDARGAAPESAPAPAPAKADPEARDGAPATGPTEASIKAAPIEAAPIEAARGPAPKGPLNRLPPEDQARRADAIEALDEGHYDLALKALGPLLDRYPSNPAVRGLHEAAVQSLAAVAQDSAARLALTPATRVARPPFVHTLVRAVTLADSGPMPRLRKVSEAKNLITDDDDWYRKNDLRAPLLEVPNPFRGLPGALPQGIPPKYGDALLVRGIAHADHTILIYGQDFGDGRFLAVIDAAGEVQTLLDFSSWLEPDGYTPGDRQFVDEVVQWAEVRDGVLYLQNGHRTYAASSKGHNAYLSAIDLATSELLWRSEPLVANALSFVIRGPAIITGYGFTAEPDFMYVVDRRDGATASKVPVKSGPDMILEKDGQLFVRTYDRDYVFVAE
ncbi:MAG: hypothetical protein R3B09_21310 [Nannocystaceae bacterium]